MVVLRHDADADGICDDEDDCIGELDACGICNGPGAIYDCGCSDIPEGDCDCDGNQLDALGVCGGDCAADANGNGVCDDSEVGGCTDSSACNYDDAATEDDGSCDYCSCDGGGEVTHLLSKRHQVLTGRQHGVPFLRPDAGCHGCMSAVFGNDEANLTVNTPLVRSAARSTRAGMLLASTLRSCLWFQTWRMTRMRRLVWTVQHRQRDIAGAADPSVVEDASQPITPYFLTNGATSLESTTLTGATPWYVDEHGNQRPLTLLVECSS